MTEADVLRQVVQVVISDPFTIGIYTRLDKMAEHEGGKVPGPDVAMWYAKQLQESLLFCASWGLFSQRQASESLLSVVDRWIQDNTK